MNSPASAMLTPSVKSTVWVEPSHHRSPGQSGAAGSRAAPHDLMDAGLVEDPGGVACGALHVRRELVELGRGCRARGKHAFAHVVHQLDEEELVLDRRHR